MLVEERGRAAVLCAGGAHHALLLALVEALGAERRHAVGETSARPSRRRGRLMHAATHPAEAFGKGRVAGLGEEGG